MIDLKEKTEGFRGLRSGISEVTIIDFGVRVKNDRKIAEWVIGLSRNQRSYNPEMGGRNAPKYAIYRNKGNARVYPYLLNVQSDIIGELHTRMVIPLVPLADFTGRPAQRLNPVITVEGGKYLVLTHEMAAVRLAQLGEEVTEVQESRQLVKDAIDFLLDGV